MGLNGLDVAKRSDMNLISIPNELKPAGDSPPLSVSPSPTKSPPSSHPRPPTTQRGRRRNDDTGTNDGRADGPFRRRRRWRFPRSQTTRRDGSVEFLFLVWCFTRKFAVDGKSLHLEHLEGPCKSYQLGKVWNPNCLLTLRIKKL